jgi:glucose-6-phosphate 1-epimerase
MVDVVKLNDEHGIPDRIVFLAGAGGLTFVELVNEHGKAIVSLQGGHLINWSPRGEKAVIWLSRNAKFTPGKSIRGGVPVCWPWFGPHSKEKTFPAHGFARTTPWQVVASEAIGNAKTCLTLRLEQHGAERRYWPYSSELVVQFTLGAALEIELITRNTGNTPITIGEALHTYFEISDVREITIHGLDGCDYLDKVDGMKRKRQIGPIGCNGETDRIYLDTTSDCIIDDPGFNRRVHISKQGSRSTVIWNPWQDKAARMDDLGKDGYMNMICVESANVADNLVSIAAGDEHRLGIIYRVETSISPQR